MRSIIKGREPASLTKHRQAAHCTYDNYVQKDELRQALVEEQRGLCCYCLSKISASVDSMKIEHWKCQSGYPDLELVYGNILGACLGGNGLPADKQHCDTRKGNKVLKWNPAVPAHRVDQRIRYSVDGGIGSDDVEFDRQINDVLGLNLAELKNRRKGVLDGLLLWWRQYRQTHYRRPQNDDIERMYRRWNDNGGGPLRAYAPVAVWWLNEKLTRSAA